MWQQQMPERMRSGPVDYLSHIQLQVFLLDDVVCTKCSGMSEVFAVVRVRDLGIFGAVSDI